ncbi:MAG: phosphatidate cytidylyltransferase [candidate division Zixibacteria bacterium]|nr:phosphatidate cytidylyltransferase [candidate division Zixibacteria bacterium]
MSRNLVARIAVAAVCIPVILWICYQGGWWLFGMIALFAALGLSEFLVNEGYGLKHPAFWGALIAIGMIFWSTANSLAGSAGLFVGSAPMTVSTVTPTVILAFFLLSGMIFATGKASPGELFVRATRLMWGVIYIGVLYPYVFLLGDRGWPAELFSGGDCLLFLFGVLWTGDTAAMFVGRWLGKHKLAPTVSPNKTVEGFVGGLVGALAIGVLMVFWKFSAVPWYHVLTLAIGCSVFGQLGDLVESMWKRSLGIKDSSAIIPGHGGILDRFDSLLFAVPFMYYYLAALY